MSLPFILLPLFVQVTLTFVIGFWLAGLRAPAVGRGEVRAQDIALREPSWPKQTLQVGNSYLNQFETPVLFYVLAILAIITKHADLLFVLLSWVFVVLRVLHAWVHVTDNNLKRRGALFGAAAAVLAIMWLIFIVKILLGMP